MRPRVCRPLADPLTDPPSTPTTSTGSTSLRGWPRDRERAIGAAAVGLSLSALIAATWGFAQGPPNTLAWYAYGASVVLLLLALPSFEKRWTALLRRANEGPLVSVGLRSLCIWGLLGLVLLLATLIRLYQLDDLPAGLWYDEADNLFHARHIQQSPGAAPVFIPSTNLPSLFLLPIAAVIELTGLTVTSGRLVSVLFGVAGVAAVFLLVRSMMGSAAGGGGGVLDGCQPLGHQLEPYRDARHNRAAVRRPHGVPDAEGAALREAARLRVRGGRDGTWYVVLQRPPAISPGGGVHAAAPHLDEAPQVEAFRCPGPGHGRGVAGSSGADRPVRGVRARRVLPAHRDHLRILPCPSRGRPGSGRRESGGASDDVQLQGRPQPSSQPAGRSDAGLPVGGAVGAGDRRGLGQMARRRVCGTACLAPAYAAARGADTPLGGPAVSADHRGAACGGSPGYAGSWRPDESRGGRSLALRESGCASGGGADAGRDCVREREHLLRRPGQAPGGVRCLLHGRDAGGKAHVGAT